MFVHRKLLKVFCTLNRVSGSRSTIPIIKILQIGKTVEENLHKKAIRKRKNCQNIKAVLFPGRPRMDIWKNDLYTTASFYLTSI